MEWTGNDRNFSSPEDQLVFRPACTPLGFLLSPIQTHGISDIPIIFPSDPLSVFSISEPQARPLGLVLVLVFPWKKKSKEK